MGTNLIRATLLASASVAVAAAALPTAAYAQEASYQFDIPAQSMGDALRALGRVTKQNVVFDGSVVRGKRSVAVRGRMSAGEALQKMLSGSGLVMTRGAGGALMVQGGNVEGTGSQPPGAPATRISAAARQGNQRAEGVVDVTVVEGGTDKRLVGALIRIGDRTGTTNDQGQVRIVGVPEGRAEVVASYLGYPRQSQSVIIVPDAANSIELLLSNSGEIVVYGTRSSRARALNKERTADNTSSVVAADDLGNFSGTTLSESLRRVPGVAFQRNGEGDGNNIIIRGLQPNLNEIKLNGLSIPEASGTGRSPELANILTDSVEEITINKTLLPSHDSAGTGGLVEIETKSPLDRPRRYASFAFEGGLRPSGYNRDFLASGTISGRFGASENFGLSASVQYRKTKRRSYSFNHTLYFGQYLPLEADGTPSIAGLFQIDPTRQFPFEEGVDQVLPVGLELNQNNVRVRNLVATVSAEWDVSDTTNLRLDVQRSMVDTDVEYLATRLFSSSYYVPTPITALGGEVRQGVIWDGYFYSNQIYGVMPNKRSTTDTASFRGESQVGKLNLKYGLGFASGRLREDPWGNVNVTNVGSPLLDPAFLRPEATDAVEGRVLSVYGQRLGRGAQLPLFNAAGFAFLNDPGNYALSSILLNGANRGRSNRYTADVKARYDFGGSWLKYLEAGANFERSTFYDYIVSGVGYYGQTSLTDLGVGLDTDLIRSNAISGGNYRVIGFDGVRRLIREAPAIAADNGYFVFDPGSDPLFRDRGSREDQLSGYVQASFQFGKLGIVGGGRYDRVKFNADIVSGAAYFDENDSPDVDFEVNNRVITSSSATVESFLPRVAMNYRESDNLVFRFGYYVSVARPSISDLADNRRIVLRAAPFYGPDGTSPALSIDEGNPALKPAFTHSFDFSAELYDGDIGAIKAGVFYKLIKRPLESTRIIGAESLEGIDLPNDPRFQALPPGTFIQRSRPVNGEKDNKIWGIEFSLEKQFTFLPGALSGFGAYMNYTYTDGSRDAEISWSAPIFDAQGALIGRESRTAYFERVPFLTQPPHSGTVALTYNKYGIDASLGYSYQSKMLSGFDGHGLSQHTGSYDSLDFKLEYRPSSKWRFFVEGSNLLRGPNDPDLLSYQGDEVLRGTYLGGREFRAGLSANF